MAPEGAYTPAWNYLLPLAPPTMVPVSQTQMQSATAKDASSSNPSAGTAGAPASSSSSSSTSAAAGGQLSPAGAATAGETRDGRSVSDPSAGGTATDRATSTPKTALSHISLAAPSAWSHAPIQPTTKLSVATVRYPPNVSTSQRNGGEGAPAINDLGGTASFHGPLLEASLSSQGIDGSPTLVTGGQGGVPGVAALQLLAHLSGTGGAGPSITTSPSLASSMLAQTMSSSSGSSGKNLLKPKNNIKQTSSSFVQRLQNHTDYTKVMGQRGDGNTIERFAFANRQRVLFWLGENANGWIKDPLARLTFASPITAHDINQHTRSPSRLDVIIGFSSADIVWFEPFSARYSRINKGGCVYDSPITSIRWLPGSETLFVCAHSDGTCTIFDVSRDDAAPGSWSPATGMSIQGFSSHSHSSLGSAEKEEEEEQEFLRNDASSTRPRPRPTAARRQPTSDSLTTVGNASLDGGSRTSTVNDGAPSSRPRIVGWDPTVKMVVTRPANDAMGNETYSRKAWMSKNPVAHWQVVKNAEISDIAFAPDSTRLAVVSTDGKVRVIDLLNERLDQTMTSYFGAFTCIAWSPDAKLLVTGGSDDLVSVWSPEGRVLARCIGHSSFIKAVAFDPWRWRADDRTYRFASVAEDGKVIMWDFSSAALQRPKMAHGSSSYSKQARSGGSSFADPHQPQGRMSMSSTRPRNSMSADRSSFAVEMRDESDGKATLHPALMRKEVAELQPVAVFEVSHYPLMPHNIDGVPTSAISSSASTAGMLGAAVPVHLNGAPSAAQQYDSVTGTSAVGNASSSPGQAGTAVSPTSAGGVSSNGGSPANAGQSTTALGNGAHNVLAAFGDIGTASDLLVGIRYRPDGLIVLHKSGTMRFLSRPKTQRQVLQQQQQHPSQPVRATGGGGWRR